ncbi:MAG: KipI antagonist, partial [Paenibacillaceae bacterium]|nr:KipI antagonist [Paenibacillaceae bacterium]
MMMREDAAEAGAIHVLAPGLSTTVQDLGRPGYRAAGVPVGGAADMQALALANLLVGNPLGAAALELTLAGPTLLLGSDTIVALCGAPFEAWLDGQALEPMRPYYAPEGAVL